MPFICYQEKNFRSDSLKLIEKINEIIEVYTQAGYSLTLRQLYYQLVARGIIPNNERSYKNTGNLINDARLAGLIDWNAIEDRTRNLKSLSHWNNPSSVIASAAYSYRNDLWKYQEQYIEVWVEKEALADVVGKACDEYDVSYFSCRGYVSQSEMWVASQRIIDKCRDGKNVTIIHLGDHDPSGIDMSRDIEDRLNLFGDDNQPFLKRFNGLRRIALNMDQIEEFNPPPNPAKLTDSRANDYIRNYGDESWELDALDPKYITELLHSVITEYADMNEINRVKEQVRKEKEVLDRVSRNWSQVYDEWK